jgi:hypothetical protein
MAQCSNCQAQLGCSCQVRKASNGASVCVNCISTYEHTITARSNEQRLTASKNK